MGGEPIVYMYVCIVYINCAERIYDVRVMLNYFPFGWDRMNPMRWEREREEKQ